MSKYTHSDLPMLRSLRDAYRWAIDEANRQKAVENDIGMLMAYCCVIDELQGHFDRVGRALDRLESSSERAAGIEA